MSVHQKVETFRAFQLLLCVASETASFVFGAVCPAGVGASVRQPARPVRMDHAECFDRKWMPHDWANHSVPPILSLTQAVAVLDADFPSSNGAFLGTNDIVDADILAQNLTAPAVMIAGHPEDVDAPISELG